MEQLDPQVVALAKAIRQTETGNRQVKGQTGELASRYQFMPQTWKSYAGEILGNPNAPLTLENENKVVYHKLLNWKKQGLNPGQIAAAWNAGPGSLKNDAWKKRVGYNNGVKYDTPAYVQKVYQNYQQFKPQGGMGANPMQSMQQEPEKKSVGGFIGNIFKSGADLVGGVGSALLHPIQTAKGLGGVALGTAEKLIPGQQGAEKYADAVGSFFKDRYGGASNIGNTLYKDPVGVLADLSTVLTGGGALASKLGTVGKLTDFANIPTKAAKAAEIARYAEAGGFGNLAKAGSTLSKAGNIVDPFVQGGKLISSSVKAGGRLGADILGVTTGAGGDAIKGAYGAGRAGGEPLDAFTSAIRGKTNPEDILQTAQGAVSDIAEARRAEYLEKFNEIVKKTGDTAKNIGTLPKAPIQETLTKQLENFGVKIGDGGKLDFRSSTLGDRAAQSVVKQIYEDISGWKDFSAQGLDTLKRRLDSYWSPASDARAFAQSAKVAVRKVLVENVPGYEKMTKGYEEASNALKEAKAAIGGPRASQESALRKLRSIFRDSQKDRLKTIRGVEAKTNRNITGQIAGMNLNPVIPGGLAKYMAEGAGGAAILSGNPAALFGLAASSPRIIGEIARALGISTRKVEQIVTALQAKTGLPRAKVLLMLYQANRANSLNNTQSQGL